MHIFLYPAVLRSIRIFSLLRATFNLVKLCTALPFLRYWRLSSGSYRYGRRLSEHAPGPLRKTVSRGSTGGGGTLCSILAESARSSVDSGMCDLGMNVPARINSTHTDSNNDIASLDTTGKGSALKDQIFTNLYAHVSIR